MEPNLTGTVNVFEATRRGGIKSIVFASGHHGWGYYEREDGPLSTREVARPDSWYGISKLFGEGVGACMPTSMVCQLYHFA
ncbi:MAG: NAD-dependent epimerase/dehydratase family protein [Rhodothermales bacterium]